MDEQDYMCTATDMEQSFFVRFFLIIFTRDTSTRPTEDQNTTLSNANNQPISTNHCLTTTFKISAAAHKKKLKIAVF